MKWFANFKFCYAFVFLMTAFLSAPYYGDGFFWQWDLSIWIFAVLLYVPFYAWLLSTVSKWSCKADHYDLLVKEEKIKPEDQLKIGR